MFKNKKTFVNENKILFYSTNIVDNTKYYQIEFINWKNHIFSEYEVIFFNSSSSQICDELEKIDNSIQEVWVEINKLYNLFKK